MEQENNIIEFPKDRVRQNLKRYSFPGKIRNNVVDFEEKRLQKGLGSVEKIIDSRGYHGDLEDAAAFQKLFGKKLLTDNEKLAKKADQLIDSLRRAVDRLHTLMVELGIDPQEKPS